jgi:hypothetical protein
MEIQVNTQTLQLISSQEKDINKAVDEALNMWLKTKIATCPITRKFCINPQSPCNDCEIVNQNFQ